MLSFPKVAFIIISFWFQVMCQFTLGVKNAFKHHFSFNKINPNSGYGFPKMYSHEQINAKEVQFNNIHQNF